MSECKPAITGRDIGQSNPLASASNTITATITISCDLWTGSTVTISGLDGTQTSNSGAIAIKSSDASGGNEGIFGTTADWDQGAGKLTVTAASPMAGATAYKVSWVLRNQAAARPSPPDLTAEATMHHQYTFNWWSDNTTPVASVAMDVATADLLGVASGSTPLLVVVPSLAVTVGQGSPLLSMSNLVSVTIRPSTDVIASSVITMAGFTGTQTDSAPDLASSGSGAFDTSAASWSKASGTLEATVTTLLGGGADTVLSFWVRNGASEQLVAPTISVSATVAVTTISGLTAPDTSPIVAADATSSAADAFGVSGGAAPLFLVEPRVEVGTISQSFPLKNAYNMIQVTLKMSCDLPVGSTVTIDGLSGTKSGGPVPVPLSAEDGTAHPNLQRYDSGFDDGWKRTGSPGGELKLNVIQAMASATTYELFFVLQNGNTQNAVTVSIQAVVVSGDATFTDTSAIDATVLDHPASASLAPLKVLDTIFTQIGVAHNNPLVLGSNLVSLTIQAVCPIFPGTRLTLTGLTGTSTDAPTITIDEGSSLASAVADAASDWDQDNGVLAITTSARTEPDTSYTVSFWLRNGADAQDPAPSISLSATLKTPSSLDAVSSSGDDIDIAAGTGGLGGPVSTSSGDLFGITGAEAPLFMFQGEWGALNVRQTNPLAGGTTRVTVAFPINCDFPPGSRVTVRGLTGSETASTSSLAVVEDTTDGSGAGVAPGALASQASFDQESGVLVFTFAATGTKGFTFTGAVALINSFETQEAPELNITASLAPPSGGAYDSPVYVRDLVGPAVPVYAIPNGTRPLRSHAFAFVDSISDQLSPYQLIKNTIRVTFTPNADLPVDSTFTLNGLTGLDLQASGGIVLSPPGELDPAPSPATGGVLNETAYFNQSASTLSFLVTGAMTKGQPYFFTFVVTNPGSLFDFPRSLAFTGSIPPPPDTPDYPHSPIFSHALGQSTLDLLGIEGGAQPFLVLVIKAIQAEGWQTSPFSSVRNTLHLRLRWTVDLGPGTTVFVEGLDGASDLTCTTSPPGGFLPCRFEPIPDVFSSKANKGLSSKVVIFDASEATVRSNSTYTLSISFKNPTDLRPDEPPRVDGTLLPGEDNQQPILVVRGFYFAQISNDTSDIALLSHGDIVPAMPSGTLLGVPISDKSLTLASPGFCIDQALNCSLSGALQSCAFRSSQAEGAVACMRACNASAARYVPECCGLQCMESCWERRLQVGPQQPVNGSLPGNATVGNVLPPITVSLLRVSPSAALNTTGAEELDSTQAVPFGAVLESECSTPTTPWDCPATGIASGGRALADPITGQATFAAIELDPSLASGVYSVIVFPESFSGERRVFHRYGGLEPPQLFAGAGWPYVTAGPFVHVKA